MRLAYICTEKLPLPAIRGGAIQMMIDGVASDLAAEHQLTIFSVTDPALSDREVKNHICYVRLPQEAYSDHVAKEITQHTFDVIHVFNRPKDVIKYKKACPQSRFVLSLHNEMFHPDKISDFEGRQAIDSVNRLMTVSRYIKDSVIRRFPQAGKKTDVVYSGADLNRYYPVWTIKGRTVRSNTRARLGIKDKKVILFVGRLSPSKGPHMLIQAMKYLLDDHPDAVLVIAGGKWFSDNGSNPYVNFLYQLAEPIRTQVIFTKYVPSDQIPDLFPAADLFVCSSQWQEPLARVHYEAMAAGVPVVTTDRGGNTEVVKQHVNGLVLEKYDRVGSFVQAIDYLLSNPFTASRLGRNGRLFVEANHDFSHVADRLLRLYNGVIRRDSVYLSASDFRY
ncbi:glycosyltransferase family 4 protein [Sporolactobacillus sp. THM19-2]|uniref:glycosyltransferase family 4 protein n=1 Tax=Sporolactobacillus sp. THM19-2 TaxID=2511171 RepID=UPI0010227DE8|nr:glycosyltransferase family 4 protein [Sporolactobacillus sp. THM19-2]RYL93268.1 glycosyltransferase family 1 protein [Sporolactobacillus sp. THM19-2]